MAWLTRAGQRLTQPGGATGGATERLGGAAAAAAGLTALLAFWVPAQAATPPGGPPALYGTEPELPAPSGWPFGEDFVSDGPTDLKLAAMTPGTAVELDGVPVGTASGDGSLIVTVGSGSHQITIVP